MNPLPNIDILRRFEVWFTLAGVVVAIREVDAPNKLGAIAIAVAGLKGKGVRTESLNVYSCREAA